MKKILLYALLLICPFILYSKTIITISDATELAVKNNKSLYNDIVDISIAKRKKIGSFNIWYPTIDIRTSLGRQTFIPDPFKSPAQSAAQSAGILESIQGLTKAHDAKKAAAMAAQVEKAKAIAKSLSEKKIEERDHWFWNFDLALSWTFQAAMITSMKASKLQYDISKLTYDKNIRNTKSKAIKDFYQILLVKDKIKLMQDNLDNLEKKYANLQRTVNAGLASPLDALKVEISVEKLKAQITMNSQNLIALKDAFKLYMGLPIKEEIELQGSIDFKPASIDDVDTLIDTYFDQREDLKQLKLQKKLLAVQKQSAILKAFTPYFRISYNFTPTITRAFRKESWEDASLPDIDTGRLVFTIGMSLTDLLPYSNTWNTIYESKQKIRKVNNNIENLKDGIKTKVKKIVNDLKTAVKMVEVYQKNVDLYQNYYDKILRAYNAGSKKQSEVDDAFVDLLTAETDLIEQKSKYITSLVDLQNELNINLN